MPGSISPPEPPVADLDFWKRALVRQAFQLSSANVLVQAARFLKNFLFARILGPGLFGLWNGLQVILVYGANVHLGVLHAIAREIPLSRGRGDLDQIPRLARVSMTVSLLASLVVGALLFAIGASLDPALVEARALKLMAAVLVVQQLFLFYQFLLRAQDDFAFLSKVLVIAAILELLASVGLVLRLGFDGIFYGFLISGGAVVVICFVAERRIVSQLQLDMLLIGNLIRIGFPIMLTGLSYNLLTTIDRVMIIKFLGRQALGYYALGPLAITAIGYLPVTINQVMYPKFGERYGATGDPKSLSGFVRVPTLVTAYVMAGVLGLAFLGLPIITLLLPKFAPGIPAARILFAGFYFLSLVGSSANLLLTINRQVQYLVALSMAVVLGVALNAVALVLGLGIEGIALATGVTYIVYGFGLIGFAVRRYLGYGLLDSVWFMLRQVTPYVLAAFLVLGLLQVRPAGVLASMTLQVGLFAVAYAGVAIVLLRRQVRG